MKRYVIYALLLLPLWLAAQPAINQLNSHNNNEPFFTFKEWAGPTLRVWFHQPEQFNANTPIVFIMHGVGRDADRYYAEWKQLAEQYGFLLLVPEFNRDHFPGAAGYNLGNIFQPDGTLNDESDWSYSAIDPIFDYVKTQTGSERSAYRIYGHSAGAQFVHRFIMFKPSAKYELAISANAGWYTLPTFDYDFPYGLKGAPTDLEKLKRLLSKRVLILLGELDNDPGHSSLRQTVEASAQGLHRFERGNFFFNAAKAKAAAMHIPFNWSLKTVPNAEHQNKQMAIAAAPLLATQ